MHDLRKYEVLLPYNIGQDQKVDMLSTLEGFLKPWVSIRMPAVHLAGTWLRLKVFIVEVGGRASRTLGAAQLSVTQMG